MTHLNLCFPEWQGYAESNSVFFGALEIQQALHAHHEFTMIEVPEKEDLFLEKDIMGYQANLRQLKATAQRISQVEPDSIFMIGGTCASEIAPVSYLNKKFDGNLTVIWFDAHGDLNTPQTSPSKHFHGMPLRALLGECDTQILQQSFSLLHPDQVILAGTRDLDPEETNYIDSHDITLVPVASMEEVLTQLERRASKNVYLHIDLDVLDPVEFPHLLYQVPNGASVGQLTELVTAIHDQFSVVGSSLVEYVPRNETAINDLQKLIAALGI